MRMSPLRNGGDARLCFGPRVTDILTAPVKASPERAHGELRGVSPAASGRLEVRFARDRDEVAAAQALRFRVFHEEMDARPDPAVRAARRDMDPFDEVCDHLLVVDHGLPASEAVVGTYRLLREDVAARYGGFYSAAEYDLGPLTGGPRRRGNLLELGRSCVHPAYRTNATIQLLWRGITRYLDVHGVDVMFGCASFPGTRPEAHRVALSYLHGNHLAPAGCRVRARAGRFAAMGTLPPGAYAPREAVRGLPPLVRAYLRLGAFVGDGAVVDHAFGTTDVFILLFVDRIAPRYFDRFGRRAARVPSHAERGGAGCFAAAGGA